MLPVQAHESHQFWQPAYLLIVLFFSGTVLGFASIYMTYLHNNGSNVLPLCSNPDRFTSVLPVESPTAVTSTTGHLPPLKSQYRDRVLATFLCQQSQGPAGSLSLLQTDLTHLLLQWLQQLAMWVSTPQLSTSDACLQHKEDIMLSKYSLMPFIF